MATTNRGGRSSSPTLVQGVMLLVSKAQTAGPRALIWTALICGFFVSWKASGALLVPLLFLVGWRLARDAIWAYGLPRWLPFAGKRVRGRRHMLASRGYTTPSFWQMQKARRAELKRFRRTRSQMGVVADVNPALLGIGGEPIPLEKMTSTLEGDVKVIVNSGSRGVPPSRYLKFSEEIRTTVGCKEVVIRYVGASSAELMFLWTEKLERELLVADNPTPVKGHAGFGTLRDGAAASIPFNLPVLVSGMTGAGKSSFSWSYLNSINVQQLPCRLWVSDNKGGAELRALSKAPEAGPLGPNGHLVVEGYASNVEEAAVLIQSFYDAMKERLAHQTFRKWTADVAAKYPLLMLLIDEMVELIKLSDRKVKDLLLTIVSQIRSAGGTVIALTQLSQKSVLDDIRDMFPIRLSLAQRSPINTDMALGTGAEADGAACSQLSVPADAGRGFMFDDTRKGYQPFRCGWATDYDVDNFISKGIGITREVAQQQMPAETQTAVYRMFNELGELLYVGISNDPPTRWKQHADPHSGNDYKPWWGEVCWKGDHKPLVRWYPDRATAERKETEACERELPRYNDRKNPDSNPLKVRWRDRGPAKRPLEPELAALEEQFDDAGLSIIDTETQPAIGDPEPVSLPEVDVPPVEPVQVPEDPMPEPEVTDPEPRHDGTEWPQMPDPAETRSEWPVLPEAEPELERTASGRTRPARRRQPVASRRR